MRQRSRRSLVLGLFLAVALGAWLFRDPLRRRIAQSAAFANPAPPPELIEEILEKSPDRTAAIAAAWNTGKIIHRETAVRAIAGAAFRDRPLPPELESIVLAGARDVDLNVRESALGILRDRNHPALAPLAAAQLGDCDPQIRLLGLNCLKGVDAGIGVPTIIPLLEEDDPLIVTSGLKLLEKWSGENFGVKLRDTAGFENEKTGLKEYREGSHEKAKSAADRARAWWAQHQSEYPPVKLEMPAVARSARQPVPAGDFKLRTPEGKNVRLSDFRGKVVLINFWTTWCTACVSEMPELIALQKKNSSNLLILGISLDYVPDSHGHVGGDAAVEEQKHGGENHNDRESDAVALKQVRDKVVRTAQARGINYTILFDEANEVGGRFNGGELPTTVIIDGEGYVRRRFVGARTLPVFAAMIEEASRPVPLAP